MVELLQRAYWIFASILLYTGLILTMITFFFLAKSKLRTDFITICFIPLFLADISMIFDFLPIDLWKITHDRVLDPDGAWCQIGAVWTIAAIVALNVNSVATAYLTQELVAERMNRNRLIKLVTTFTGIGWAVGIVSGMIFYATGQTGLYRGLYCCLTNPGRSGVFFPYFIVVLLTLGTMFYYYKNAIAIAKEVYESTGLSRAKKSRQSQSSSKSKEIPPHIKELIRVSVYTLAAFYFCWFMVSFLGLFKVARVEYDIRLDMVAAFFLKLQPIANNVLMLRAIRKSLRLQELHKIGAAAKGDTTQRKTTLSSPNSSTVDAELRSIKAGS